MSAIIESFLMTGLSAYAIVRDTSGNVWNGSAFETFNASNWATYAISLVEQGTSYYYKATFPSSITPGLYSFCVHQGSPPTAGDQGLDRGTVDWNGTTMNALETIVVKLPSGSISGFDPTVSNVNLNSNQSGVTVGTVNALGASAISSVKSQIDASVGSDAIPELTGVTPATPTLKQAVMFLLMALRNKRTGDATTLRIYNASGAVISSAPQNDNTVTYTKDQFV